MSTTRRSGDPVLSQDVLRDLATYNDFSDDELGRIRYRIDALSRASQHKVYNYRLFKGLDPDPALPRNPLTLTERIQTARSLQDKVLQEYDDFNRPYSDMQDVNFWLYDPEERIAGKELDFKNMADASDFADNYVKKALDTVPHGLYSQKLRHIVISRASNSGILAFTTCAGTVISVMRQRRLTNLAEMTLTMRHECAHVWEHKLEEWGDDLNVRDKFTLHSNDHSGIRDTPVVKRLKNSRRSSPLKFNIAYTEDVEQELANVKTLLAHEEDMDHMTRTYVDDLYAYKGILETHLERRNTYQTRLAVASSDILQGFVSLYGSTNAGEDVAEFVRAMTNPLERAALFIRARDDVAVMNKLLDLLDLTKREADAAGERLDDSSIRISAQMKLLHEEWIADYREWGKHFTSFHDSQGRDCVCLVVTDLSIEGIHYAEQKALKYLRDGAEISVMHATENEEGGFDVDVRLQRVNRKNGLLAPQPRNTAVVVVAPARLVESQNPHMAGLTFFMRSLTTNVIDGIESGHLSFEGRVMGSEFRLGRPRSVEIHGASEPSCSAMK